MQIAAVYQPYPERHLPPHTQCAAAAQGSSGTRGMCVVVCVVCVLVYSVSVCVVVYAVCVCVHVQLQL